jgi:hypothetical protein
MEIDKSKHIRWTHAREGIKFYSNSKLGFGSVRNLSVQGTNNCRIAVPAQLKYQAIVGEAATD